MNSIQHLAKIMMRRLNLLPGTKVKFTAKGICPDCGNNTTQVQSEKGIIEFCTYCKGEI